MFLMELVDAILGPQFLPMSCALSWEWLETPTVSKDTLINAVWAELQNYVTNFFKFKSPLLFSLAFWQLPWCNTELPCPSSFGGQPGLWCLDLMGTQRVMTHQKQLHLRESSMSDFTLDSGVDSVSFGLFLQQLSLFLGKTKYKKNMLNKMFLSWKCTEKIQTKQKLRHVTSDVWTNATLHFCMYISCI